MVVAALEVVTALQVVGEKIASRLVGKTALVVTASQVVKKKIASWLVGEDRIGGGDHIADSGEEGMTSVYMKVPGTLKLSSGLSLRYGLNRGVIEPLSGDVLTRKDIHGKKTYAERGEGTQTEGGYTVTRFHG